MPSTTKCPNIYIIGPQSTGKTTLVNELHRQLGTWLADTSFDLPHVIPETARIVLEQHNISSLDVTASEEQCINLQRLIIEAQSVAEEEALSISSWFISDRSAIDPLIYVRRYASAQAAEDLRLLESWAKLRERMTGSLIVVCESGTPWLVDDGIRLMPEGDEAWNRLYIDFCAVLQELNLTYCVVPQTMLGLPDRAEFRTLEDTETDCA
ncbi:AAA domain-containing protein [Sarocladium implicatum]|nr:AAA domain-containing protein [Sarocladium implicatum]